jgi:hypothetical protein
LGSPPLHQPVRRGAAAAIWKVWAPLGVKVTVWLPSALPVAARLVAGAGDRRWPPG